MKKLGLLCLLLLAGLLPSFRSSASAEILYRVAYSADQQTYITTFYSDQTVQTTEVPFMFWQYAIALVAPQWVGSQLWGTLESSYIDPSDGADLGGGFSVIGYDADTETLTEPILLVDPPNYEAVRVRSVSPDAQYAWVEYSNYFNLPSLLVNLTDGTVHTTECVGNVLAWFPESVLVSNTWMGSQPCPQTDIYTLSLADGSRLESYSIPPEKPDESWSGYPEAAIPLSDGRFILGGNSEYGMSTLIGFLTVDPPETHWLEAGSPPTLSADENYMAYINPESELVVVKVPTQTEVLRTAGIFNTVFFAPLQWSENTLAFWQTQADGKIAYSTWAEGELTQEIRYEGESPLNRYSSPSGNALLLDFGDSLTVLTPTQMWQSGTDFPAEAQVLDSYSNQQWLGDWLLFFMPDYSTLAFNTQTGETIFPPAPTGRLVSLSPDEAWWLYQIPTPAEAETNQDSLIAYHPATQTTLALLEEVYLELNNFHFTPDQYFVWSD